MKIAVLPGDGIGPEIVAQAVKVLRRVAQDGIALDLVEAPVGGAGYDASGDPLPDATLAMAREADAILFGSVGGPQYDTLPRAKRPEQALLRLRKALGLFANLRPATIYPELAAASTLKPEVVAGLDILILRELTGDIYFGEPRGIRTLDSGEREGFDTMRYSERREPARGHPFGSDDAALQSRPGRRRRPRRSGGAPSAGGATAHGGHRRAGNDTRGHGRNGRRGGRRALAA